MLVTVVARYLYYIFLSSILEFCSGNYPSWLAVFPAVALVVTDLAKNLALMQLYLHGNLAFYNVRTALTALIFDKVSKQLNNCNYPFLDVASLTIGSNQHCDWHHY